ncbi:MAG: hypothetical protein RR873_05065, partial [Christensenella sp.]
MYDSQMYQRAILSPFLQFCPNDVIEREIRDGYAKKVRSIIVEPYQAPLLKRIEKECANGITRTGMTIGYPFGGLSTETKVALTQYALAQQLDEVDIGININAILSNDWDRAHDELEKVLRAADGKMNVI